MKRVYCTTNKRNSLYDFAKKLKSSTFPDDKYTCMVDLEDNTVDVYEKVGVNALGNILVRYTLDTTEDQVNRYRFRKATADDIAADVPLFVKEPYVADVRKQVPKAKQVDSIANRIDL